MERRTTESVSNLLLGGTEELGSAFTRLTGDLLCSVGSLLGLLGSLLDGRLSRRRGLTDRLTLDGADRSGERGAGYR